jgi:O-antigen/teichoic acid export membrane protein
MRSAERRFLRSTLAAYGSQLGRVLIRAASDLALARIIVPDAFGIYELALALAVIAAIVRDLGLPYELVRHPRRPYGAVLAWEAGAGLALALALMVAAPAAASLNPRLPAVLAVYAWWVLLDGLAVVPRVYFECELEVGRLVAPEIARGAAVAAVSIGLAAAGAGVWALVAGQLAGAALFAVLLWGRAWGRIPLQFSRGEAAALPGMIRNSSFLFLIALAALPVPQVSKLIVGSGLGVAAGAFWTAQYNKAREWGFRLQELVMPAVARVLYPALIDYRRRGDRGRYLGAYRMGTVTLLGLQTLGGYFLAFNAEVVLVRILIGPQWARAVPLVQVLCFAPLADPFSPLGGELLKSEGQDRAWFAVVALNIASLTVAGILLTHRMGAIGMAWANYLLAGSLLMAWRVYRICGGAEFGRLARDLLYLYLVPLPLFALVAWWQPPATWGRLAASVPAAAAAFGLYLARFGGPFRGFFATAPEPASAAVAASLAGEAAPLPGDPAAGAGRSALGGP